MNAGTSTNAILALVFGVLSFLGGGPFTGIAAWIIGRTEIQRIDAGLSPETGRGMAQAGMILGIVATAIAAVALLVVLLWFGLIATLVLNR